MKQIKFIALVYCFTSNMQGSEELPKQTLDAELSKMSAEDSANKKAADFMLSLIEELKKGADLKAFEGLLTSDEKTLLANTVANFNIDPQTEAKRNLWNYIARQNVLSEEMRKRLEEDINIFPYFNPQELEMIIQHILSKRSIVNEWRPFSTIWDFSTPTLAEMFDPKNGVFTKILKIYKQKVSPSQSTDFLIKNLWQDTMNKRINYNSDYEPDIFNISILTQLPEKELTQAFKEYLKNADTMRILYFFKNSLIKHKWVQEYIKNLINQPTFNKNPQLLKELIQWYKGLIYTDTDNTRKWKDKSMPIGLQKFWTDTIQQLVEIGTPTTTAGNDNILDYAKDRNMPEIANAIETGLKNNAQNAFSHLKKNQRNTTIVKKIHQMI